MATPSNATRPMRRKSSSTNIANRDDADLTRSLNRLSLSTPSGAKSNTTSKTQSTPLRPPSRRSSPSPHRPLSSRSPSHGRDPEAGPTLLRKASMNSLHSASGGGPPHIPSRRSSSSQILSPTFSSSFGAAQTIPEKPPVTAATVASNHFRAEFEAHHGQTPTQEPQTVVILNDAVYGHRFSRPRTSRNALSTIVERPERIKAAVLGVSLAYVRLGERHSEGAVPIHPKMNINTLPRIPFRIQKTTRRLPLTSQAVTNVHGCKWMEELKLMCDSAESRLAMGGKELQRLDMPRGNDQSTPEKLHEGDLYLCSESLNAMEGALGAVCDAVDTVFGQGPRRAFVGVRPPGHHCSASHPSGFCWVNNVHVGIMHAAMDHDLTHAAIIDFDLHHGDGSQAITWDHNSRSIGASRNAAAWKRTSIGYFSLHDINSYPCELGDEEKVRNASVCIENAHGQNIWNIHLHSWKTERDFWKLYETKYSVLLEKTRDYLRAQSERVLANGQTPKAAIFFSAGFDASEWESAGMQRHQVNVPTEFYARLSEDVVALAKEEGLSVDGRVISVLEGGYSDRALCSGIFSHLTGLVGSRISNKPLEADTIHCAEGSLSGLPHTTSREPEYRYDPSWWSHAELDRLESLMGRPPTPPKKPRHTTPPTYSSPTQASSAKVLEPIRVRRSLSGLNSIANARPPSPPPPEVPWTVAVHKFSNILIPGDRQTDSCKAEDLNAEATRARRDRQSALSGGMPIIPPPTPDRPTPRMGLRDRKAKLIIPINEEDGEQIFKNRRKTAPSAPASPEKTAANSAAPYMNGSRSRQPSRRLSGVSPATFSPIKDGRPQSAHADVARPGSSMSTGTQSSDKMPVKKTRPPAQRVTRSAKKPAASATKSRSSKSAALLNQGTPTPAPAPRPSTSGSDMDSITSGMKKIRINLITQAQKEAKSKASSAAPTPVEEAPPSLFGADRPLISPNTEREGSAPSSSHSGVYDSSLDFTSHSGLAPHPTAFSSSGLSTPVLEHEPATPEPYQVALPDSTPTTPQIGIQPSGDAGDVFIPYQPEGPTPVALTQQEPLKWMAPNAAASTTTTPAATPSPVKKQEGLFHYRSGIPFAPRPGNKALKAEASPNKAVKGESKPTASLWDIPETPQH